MVESLSYGGTVSVCACQKNGLVEKGLTIITDLKRRSNSLRRPAG